MTITGHDVARELERIGVPEGLEEFASHDWCQIETLHEDEDEPCAAHISLSGRGGPVLNVFPDHPRAMEATTLLLQAYQAAKEGV